MFFKNMRVYGILPVLWVVVLRFGSAGSLYGAEAPIVLFSNEENSELVEYSTTDFFSAAVLAEARLRLQEIEVSYKVPIRLAFGGFHITTYEMGIPYEQSNSLLETSESIDARALRGQIVQEKGGKLMGQMTQALRADHINGQEAAAWLVFSSHLYPFTEGRSLNYLSKEVLLNGNVSSDIQTLLRSVAPTLKFFSGNGLEKNDAFLLEVIGLLEKALLQQEEQIQLALTSVEFLGDFPIEDVASPEWRKVQNTTTSGPLCYKRGDQILVKPNFTAEGIAGATRIRARIDNETFAGTATFTGGVLTSTAPIATIELPNIVDLIPVLTIRWEVLVDGRWVLVEVTQHKVYVTLGVPLVYESAKEKLLFYGCSLGKGDSTEGNLIDKLWAPFSNRNVTLNLFDPNAPAKALTYYKNIEPKYLTSSIINSKPAEGRFYADGECGAFASLFSNLLQAQGIKCNTRGIGPKKEFDEGFLVKNWAFNPQGRLDPVLYLGYTHANEVNAILVEHADKIVLGNENDLPQQLKAKTILLPIADIRRPNHTYEWIGIPDVKDQLGISSHGTANPYSDFGTHYVVIMDSRVYDPSYGNSFNSLNEWEESSVEGFYRFYEDKENKKYYIYFRENNPNETEIE